MPSQISLRTSPVEVGQKSAERFAGGGEDDMKAAARTVGSLLVAHKAVRHPHSDVASVTFNGCGRNGNLPSNGASKSNGTLTAPSLQESHHHRHINGMIGLSPQPPTSIPLKTYGEASNERCSLTNDPPALTKDSSNRDLLMCPELAISYSGAMIGKRTGLLCGKQRDLEHRVSSLQRKVRLRQLSMVRAHACKQLNFQRSELSTMSVGDSSTSSFNGSDSLMADESSKPREVLPLPIQVDGASDDTFLPSHHELAKAAEEDGASDRAYGGERSRNQDSFSSLDSSYLSSVSSEAEESGARSVGAQLSALQGLLDEELTEASSDEEEGEREETADPQEQRDLRHVWDDSRLAIGSRWVWLQRRIAELNKQIYRLDHHAKECSLRREKLEFAAAPHVSPAKPLLSPYFSITNGSVLEHLRTANGAGGLIAVGKPGGSGNNGFSHHPHPTGHAHCLPQLLLPDALLGAKLQVKDLLSPSSVDRNLLYVDESSCTAARTRALLRRPNRRVIRKKAVIKARTSSHQTVDMAFHPQLSMAHELPSRIPLDCALKQVLSEHSYAQLPPLRKRRKVASILPRISTTPISQDAEGPHSPSASPVHTPHSLDSTREWSSHKKSSVESVIGSPWSPRPLTPSMTTPLQSARKKRVTNSTPLFDIDNIVIPYSMASSTRLEKLEYKEILTPSWREVKAEGCFADMAQQLSSEKTRRSPSACSDTFVQPGARDGGQGDEEEDLSDQAFMARHNRCELGEKKRFLNFISGNQRKRSRPQSMTLSEGGSVTSPPPPRRLTIASPCPSHAEPELLANVTPVVVLPWQPREFPLNETEQAALVTPPPPPPTVTRPLSPVLHTPSQTPSRTSSAVPTPAASPRSTPSEGTPAVSPAEWVVNSQFPVPPPSAAHYNHCHLGNPADSTLLASSLPPPHNPIILKLTKKTC